MHRFTTGDYLLRTTKDRILLITSKTRMLQLKRETGDTHSILGWFSTDFRKLKLLSKHLLPQGEGVLARASLIAVKVQCRPDFPLENLSMDVGPARQPRSPLAFLSRG